MTIMDIDYIDVGGFGQVADKVRRKGLRALLLLDDRKCGSFRERSVSRSASSMAKATRRSAAECGEKAGRRCRKIGGPHVLRSNERSARKFCL